MGARTAGAGLALAAAALLSAACSGLTGLDALDVVAAEGQDAAVPGQDASRPSSDSDAGVDGGATTAADSGSHPTGPLTDSASPLVDTGTSPVDSGAASDDAAPPSSTSCVPLGVMPCGASDENCLVDPDAPDADPLDPPGECFTVTGGLAQGEPCSSSDDCAVGLDCIGDPEAGGYSCQWMCYDSVGAILTPPPFDAGVLGPALGRGGCPAFQACEPVDGYPGWLGACTSGS
jgi:hypothetical protein